MAAMPSTSIALARLQEGVALLDLFVETGLTESKGDARRLVQQGGAYVNDVVIGDAQARVSAADLKDGAVMLRAGKKKYHRIVAG
jgi:tyrosyl-tRNA synthetase